MTYYNCMYIELQSYLHNYTFQLYTVLRKQFYAHNLYMHGYHVLLC